MSNQLDHEAVYALHPNIQTIDCYGVATDKNGSVVSYDINAVNAKSEEMKAAQIAIQQESESHKANAISKLTTLGLTEAEIKALIGSQ